jgi:hypothetical protein
MYRKRLFFIIVEFIYKDKQIPNNLFKIGVSFFDAGLPRAAPYQ